MDRPQNILFILTDQWPSWAFSFMSADIPTPNVDRLAGRGTVFSNAFTSCPLCTPARGALLTARWPHQTGVYDNFEVGHSQQPPMLLDEWTWIDAAVKQGFHVGYYGKWHLGPHDPQVRGAQGFDHPSPNQTRKKRPPYSYERMAKYYTEEEQSGLLRGRAPFWGEIDRPLSQVDPFPVMANGVRFLEEWAGDGQEKPFFLTVSATPPHFPHYLPAQYARIADELRERINLPPSIDEDFSTKPWFHGVPWWPCMDTSVLDRDEWRTVIAYAHAHIMLVDEAIGRVLDSLDHLGLTDSTTIVFTADHGDMDGAHNRFDKGPYFYEEVWRIPLIIAHPMTPSAVQDAFVSILDIGETLFDLVGTAGCPPTSRSGRSLLPLVGEPDKPAAWPDLAFGVYDLYNGISFAVRAVRDERYKYIWNPQDVDELYDLETDPHEMVNLTDDPANAGVKSGLRAELLCWLEEISDDLPSRTGELPTAGTVLATGKPGP